MANNLVVSNILNLSLCLIAFVVCLVFVVVLLIWFLLLLWFCCFLGWGGGWVAVMGLWQSLFFKIS